MVRHLVVPHHFSICIHKLVYTLHQPTCQSRYYSTTCSRPQSIESANLYYFLLALLRDFITLLEPDQWFFNGGKDFYSKAEYAVLSKGDEEDQHADLI